MDDTNFINLCGLVASLDIPFPVCNQTSVPVALISENDKI